MSHFQRTCAFCLAGLIASAMVHLAPNICWSADPVVFGFDGEISGNDRLPHPWTLLGHPRADAPSFTVEEDVEQGIVLRLHAVKNQSDGIRRVANVDLTETPFINFQWKVSMHPDGQVGTKKNDAAVRVQLDFGRRGFSRQVLSYVYDAKAKTRVWYDDSSPIARNKALVLDSGDEHLDQWVGRSRNVMHDYLRLYRSTPKPIQNVVIFTDSNDSDSEAIGYCGRITFSSKALYVTSSDPSSSDPK